MDFETDPFVHERHVKPFACGLYDGRDFMSEWSEDCAERIITRLRRFPPAVIYMHNGGKFDFFFLLRHLGTDLIIINGRIVKATIGDHEIRDSFAILPIALGQYKKDDIDIDHLEASSRESHKDEILRYLRGDCVYLHELVTGFREEFGDALTIGSAAMLQLTKRHKFARSGSDNDAKFRKNFYFGGRVQCIESGLLNVPYKIYDVNSMYPHVMRNCLHPSGRGAEVSKRVERNTCFVVVEGRQLGPYGIFPSRVETGKRKGSLTYDREYGTFCITIHEWEAALETCQFAPAKVFKTYGFTDRTCFDSFVDHFYGARLLAKSEGDKARELFYKLILNSAYGKFAQNPEHFADWKITRGERMAAPWSLAFVHNKGEYTVFNFQSLIAKGGSHVESTLVSATCRGRAGFGICATARGDP